MLCSSRGVGIFRFSGFGHFLHSKFSVLVSTAVFGFSLNKKRFFLFLLFACLVVPRPHRFGSLFSTVFRI